ncbi:hypothetical protein [Hymenobacter psychrotolerans]|uniref:SdiA-regulated n=1 Tax=Hymenobacter psychrotolerans DSM 18569 TaxID=1121959 RepID=A0A1M6S191_9BACT|nr:hypothetical protein [Hymenobacter psychrotolerans]SHK38460.1 hypothetical protein SAMN02746009_00849 [Hymenobacter psychrotolerans DSM 18569]
MLFLLRDKLFPALVFLQSVICGCGNSDGRGDFSRVSEQYTVTQTGKIRKGTVGESSGFALADKYGSLWTHGDGGSAAALFKVTPEGDLLQTLNLNPLVNIDWEDLARDPEGRIYIGDFGNNQNKRRNLCIYRLSGSDLRQVDTIRFSYPDQRRFPPRKTARNFDCEAFFYRQDSLYLFTKNRGNSKYVKMYALPARPGRHVATLLDSIRVNTWVTSADISPDGLTVALLGYGHIYLVERQPGRRLFDGSKSCLPIASTGQAEALAFINNTDFVFSNEKGRIYLAKKKPR